MKKNILRYALIILLLVILTIVNVLLIRGKHTWMITYPLKSVRIEDIRVDHPELIEITKISYNEKNGHTSIDFKAKKPGTVTLTADLDDKDAPVMSCRFIITSHLLVYEDGFFGSIDHLFPIRIEIPIIMAIMLINIIVMIIRTVRDSMYSYRFMYYVGIAVFLTLSLIVWIIRLFINRPWLSQLFTLYSSIMGTFTTFATFTFPLFFFTAIFLIISNISLMRHEGRSLKNMLGIILGLFLVIMSITGFFSYNLLDNIIDVHSYLGFHIAIFIEYTIYAVISYLECLMIGTLICSKIAQSHIPTFNKDYIIILGCAMLKDGTATPLLKGRADKAIWFADKQKEATGKDIMYVASGGKGDDEPISEARSISNYLISKGIPGDQILLEEKSTTTRENMIFSYELIKSDADRRNIELTDKGPATIAFSTTNYHVFRSGHIAYSEGVRVSGVGAKTKWYFYINALIREFIANLSIERKKHIKNIVIIIISIIALLALSYNYNIM